MSARNDIRTNGCIFQWKIENLSHCCWLREEVGIASPTFDTDAVYGTKWSLHLYPLGGKTFENTIGLYLERENDMGYEIEVNYHLAFLSKNGTILKEFQEEISFKVGERLGNHKFESQKRVFLTQRNEFLPEDVLTVQCTLRELTDWTSFRFRHIYARTVFKVNRRSVLWNIDKFSTMKPNLRNKFKDKLIDLDLVLNQDSFNMDVISYDDSIKYISVNISIMDSEWRKTNCGVGEFNGSKVKQVLLGTEVAYGKFNGIKVEKLLYGTEVVYGKFNCTYHVSRIPEELMKNKSRYMPNDVLSLNIEYVYSTITNSYEFFDSETDSPQITKVVENSNEHYIGEEKSQNL